MNRYKTKWPKSEEFFPYPALLDLPTSHLLKYIIIGPVKTYQRCFPMHWEKYEITIAWLQKYLWGEMITHIVSFKTSTIKFQEPRTTTHT